jgi:FKBP-type peptidyl-prolyl cis-trans isomerase
MKRSVNKLIGATLVAMTLGLGLNACLDSPDIEDPNIQLQKDIQTIDNYLLLEGEYNVMKDAYTGIRIVIRETGKKLPARTTATKVSVDYKGYTLPGGDTGATFDEGNIDGAISNFISGWQAMLLKLPVGTRADIYIPSYWAYGTSGNNAIPPNTPLLFKDFKINSATITETEITQFKKDTAAITTYLKAKSLEDVVVRDTTGISYRITTEGAGPPALWFSKVSFKATYKLLTDDTKTVAEATLAPVANSTDSRPVDYIQGLMVGLQKLREGSKATFYIPSGLGFGVAGAPPGNTTKVIPADANIIVDIEVTDIQ